MTVCLGSGSSDKPDTPCFKTLFGGISAPVNDFLPTALLTLAVLALADSKCSSTTTWRPTTRGEIHHDNDSRCPSATIHVHASSNVFPDTSIPADRDSHSSRALLGRPHKSTTNHNARRDRTVRQRSAVVEAICSITTGELAHIFKVRLLTEPAAGHLYLWSGFLLCRLCSESRGRHLKIGPRLSHIRLRFLQTCPFAGIICFVPTTNYATKRFTQVSCTSLVVILGGLFVSLCPVWSKPDT